MALSDAQLPALKAHILAATDPQFVQWRNEGATGMMAEMLNQPSNPEVIVWKSSVTWDEIMLNGMDWARVDNLTVGKARIWDWMFKNGLNAMNPSKPNIRAGIDATWVGTAADLAVRASVYGHCKRPATRAEAIYTPTGTTATPGTLVWEGFVSDYDVTRAITLP